METSDLKSRGAMTGYALAGALMAAGLYIRLRGLGGWYFSPDEAMALDYAGLTSWKEFLEFVPSSGHPPLFFLIMHALMQWSLAPVFLRSISLGAGIAAIPVFFALGKKACGDTAGMAMAFLAAFGAGAILMSSVVRAYSLEALLIASALYFFLDGLKRDRRRALLLYLIFITLAVWVHYSALIVFGAASATWIYHLARRRSPLWKWLTALAFHLPTLLTLSALYFFFLRGAMGSDNQVRALEGWLRPYYASDAGSLFKNLILTFDFCVGWPSPYLLGPVAGIGLTALFRKYSRHAAILSVMVLVLGLVMNLLKLSPLGAIRHSYYLFPVLALLLGSSCQALFDWLRRRGPVVSRALTPGYVAVVILIASAAPFLRCLANIDYYRTRNRLARWEFSLSSRDYAQAMAFLQESVPASSLALTDSSTSLYLTLGSQLWTLPSDFPDLVKLAAKGRTWQVSNRWTLNSPELLAKLLTVIKSSPHPGGDSIYIFNMGDYQDELRNSLGRLGQGGLVYECPLDRPDALICIVRLEKKDGPAGP
jgi:hypothetical protein